MYSYLILALIAAQALDYDMTPQEQKATGISKLSGKQKKALQEWIDIHYAKREEPLEHKIVEEHPTIQENLHGGRYIRLSDNSNWEINPEDTNITQSWITPSEIIATQSGQSDYPYQLTNSLTGSSVRARKVKKIPKSVPAEPTPPAATSY